MIKEIPFEEFHKLLRETMEICPNLREEWVSKSLHLILSNKGEEAVQEYI